MDLWGDGGPGITGVVEESGWLRVTVTDPLDRSAGDSLDVTVGIGPCHGDDPDDPVDDPDDTLLVVPPPPGS